MSIAYWCILIAAVLPYVWVGFAKSGAAGYNNKDPRGWLAKQDNYRVRNANGAHLNAFEAFPAFAAGVLMAQLASVDPGLVSMLAIAFVVLRVVHGIVYLAGAHAIRSLVWLGGLACVLALMASAALKVAT
ncbi:MAG: MAPEG family protein [Pseudomonadota bacterium]